MRNLARSIACYAGILSTIFDHNMANVNVAYNIPMYCYILSNEKSSEMQENKQIVYNQIATIHAVYLRDLMRKWLNNCMIYATQSVRKQLDKCYYS